jgi:glycosyltransferase involved in cell wall biosynthesis
LNILITTHVKGVAGSIYSILYLAEGLQKKGHNLWIGCPENSLLSQLAVKKGLTLIDIPFQKKFDRNSIRRIKDAVATHKIEIINAQESRDRYAAAFFRMLHGYEGKIVFTRRQRVADHNAFKRWIHNTYADHFVFISEGLKKIYEKKGYLREKMQVIYNGLPQDPYQVDDEKVNGYRNVYQLKGKRVIGSVSRLKRQDLIISALDLLPHNVVSLMVGITRDTFVKKFGDQLLKRVEERVIFTGPIKDKTAVIQHYPLIDVHILASEMDGFGLATLEAMLMGIPVIGSDYGGIPDVIKHGETGYIFQNGNTLQLKEQIESILSDSELRKQFVEKAYQRALQDFSIAKTVDGYEAFFTSLLKKPVK